MKKDILFALALSFASLSAFAIAPSDMRFHCNNDTLKINELLRKGAECGKNNANELVAFYAKQLLGTPYVAHTLESDREWLTINIDELDCTTFVETLYALTRATLDMRRSWRDFARNIESIRYRNGELGDYSSRLHYVSDWILNNSARGIVRDITPDIPGATYMVKTLDYMSTHRDKYPALADSATFEKLKSAEIGYRSHRYPLVKKSAFNSKGAKKMLRNGDIVVFITKTEGLDASHMGIIKIINDEPYLLHASSAAGKVTLETEKISETLRRSLSTIGVRVVRVLE